MEQNATDTRWPRLAKGGRSLRDATAVVRSTLERSEELAEAPRKERERDRDRQCNRYVRWMLGGRCATSHGADIDITSPRLRPP